MAVVLAQYMGKVLLFRELQRLVSGGRAMLHSLQVSTAAAAAASAGCGVNVAAVMALEMPIMHMAHGSIRSRAHRHNSAMLGNQPCSVSGPRPPQATEAPVIDISLPHGLTPRPVQSVSGAHSGDVCMGHPCS